MKISYHPDISGFISSKFIAIIAVVCVAVLSIFAISSGSFDILVVAALSLAGLVLLTKPHILLMLSVVLHGSDISPFFFPPAMNISVFVACLFVVAAIGKMLMHNSFMSRRGVIDFLCLLYAAVLVMLMVVRGSGFKILGGDTWGGTHYIVQFSSIGLFLLVSMTRLPVVQWKRIIIWMLIFSAIRPLADMVFLFSHGQITFQYLFVRAEGGGLMLGSKAMEQTSGFMGDVFRIHSASQFGISMILMTFLLSLLGRINSIKKVCLWGLGILACGVAGYRSNLFYVLILVVLFVVTSNRADKMRSLLAIILAGGLLYGILALSAEYLPLSFQRTLSALPGIKTTVSVQMAGESTVEWRIELWKRVAEQIPRYFWIGKGLVFDPFELQAMQLNQKYGAGNYDLQIWSREYHNGPLALIVDLGVPGAVVSFALILALAVMFFKRLRHPWKNMELFACYRVVGVSFLASVVMFFLSFGDVRSIPAFLFLGSILRGIAVSDEQHEISDDKRLIH